jgi:hypothetical protein
VTGLLTYCPAPRKGFDPVNDPVDLSFEALGYVFDRINWNMAIELFFCLLDCL